MQSSIIKKLFNQEKKAFSAESENCFALRADFWLRVKCVVSLTVVRKPSLSQKKGLSTFTSELKGEENYFEEINFSESEGNQDIKVPRSQKGRKIFSFEISSDPQPKSITRLEDLLGRKLAENNRKCNC